MKRKFFLTYLATAVLGGVIVFFGAPVARGFISPVRFDKMVGACRSRAPVSGVLMAMIGWTPSAPPEPVFDRPRGEQPTIWGSRGRPSSRPTESIPRPPTQRVVSGNDSQTPTPPPPTPTYDYGKMWAVVTGESAAVYDANGNLAQELDVGTLVEVAAIKTSQSDRLAVCRYNTQPSSMPLAIIRARDLAIREGSLDSANPDLLELIRKQAKLEVDIKGVRSSELAELAKKNPHAETYNRATAACLDFNRNAKSIRAKAESSSGSARMEHMDKLRHMKEEEAQLRRQYESAKSAYDAWNASHGSGSGDSAAMSAMKRELAEIQQQVRRLETK